MSHHSFSTESAIEAMKGAPPVFVAASAAVGAVDWQTWVWKLTAAYIVLQMIYLVVFKMAGWRRGKDRDDGED